jgi:hypothetical protein
MHKVMEAQSRSVRELLRKFEFRQLFLERWLWNHPRILAQDMTLNKERYTLTPVADQGGFVVIQVHSKNGDQVPPKNYRENLAHKLAKTVHEHLLIFINRSRSYSIWHWIGLEDGQKVHKEIKLDITTLSDEQVQILDRLKWEDVSATIAEVTNQVNRVLSTFRVVYLRQGGEKMDGIEKALKTVLQAIALGDKCVCDRLPRMTLDEQEEAIKARKALQNLAKKASILKTEWDDLKKQFPMLAELQIDQVPAKTTHYSSRRTPRKGSKDRLPKGVRTPQSRYRVPILRALVDMGGEGKVDAVLNKVYEQVKDILKPVDKEQLRKGEVRWRNAALWTRNDLKNKGYLKKGSPIGIWEITEAGRAYLQEQEGSE